MKKQVLNNYPLQRNKPLYCGLFIKNNVMIRCICEKPIKIRCKYTSRKYWVYGYTKEYVLIKRVKSSNKYYKTFKLDIKYIILNSKKKCWEWKSIAKNTKVIYNQEHYSLIKLRNKRIKHKSYNDSLKKQDYITNQVT